MTVSASQAIQKAAVAALQVWAPLSGAVSGIYDGPPPRAVFPFVSIGSGASSDWSTKTARGRELRVALTVWDDGEEPARLSALMHEAELAIAQISGAHDGWRIASNAFLRSLVARDAAGPWAGLIEFRIRVLED
jgi:hypothetical protein